MALVMCLFLSWTGCSDSKKATAANSGATTATVKLGAILPLTGDLAKYGATSRAAIELAVAEVNASPGNSGLKLEVVFEDDAMSPAKGVAAAKKLIDVDKVQVIVGPLASTVAFAVAPVAQKAGVVLLSPGASAPGITDAGKYIFRNCLSDEFEGAEMARFVLSSLPARQIAIYRINNDFGAGLTKVFSAAVTKGGGQIIGEESFEQGGRNHRSALTKLKALSPQAIYLVGYDEMISVYQQARELGISTQWLGTTFLSDQSLVEKMNGEADGSILAAWVYNPASDQPKIAKFVANFRQKSGGLNPDVYSANGYDAIHLLAEAIRQSGTSSAQISDGLLAIRDFDGVTGKTTFEASRDVRKSIDFKKIIDGKLEPYTPAR